MDKMTDLNALLRHDRQMLYSAEEQLIAAMPAMIGRVHNPLLKKALETHLRRTETQREDRITR